MPKITNIYYEKEKGFWIDEPRFEIVSVYIVRAFEKKGLEDRPSWYKDLYEDFEDIAKGHVQGMMFVTFELLGDIREWELEIIQVFELAKDLIIIEGEKVSVEKLNGMQSIKDWPDTKVEWIAPMYTADMTQTIDIMISMLKHEWIDGNFEMKFR